MVGFYLIFEILLKVTLNTINYQPTYFFFFYLFLQIIDDQTKIWWDTDLNFFLILLNY